MDPRLYLALLNGLSKRIVYGDETVTNSYLKEELFSELPEEGWACQFQLTI
jgi:hypothetical protein